MRSLTAASVALALTHAATAQPLLLFRSDSHAVGTPLMLGGGGGGMFAVHSWALPTLSAPACPHRLAALMNMVAASLEEGLLEGGGGDDDGEEEGGEGGGAHRARLAAVDDGEEEGAAASATMATPRRTDWAWLSLCVASGAGFTVLAATVRGAVADGRQARRRAASPPSPSLLEPLAPGEVAGAVMEGVIANPAFLAGAGKGARA